MVSRKENCAVRLAAVASLLVSACLVGLPAGKAVAQTKNLKMAFFASPKHPIYANIMMPWAKALEAANVGIKVTGYPGSQIGGSPPGAFKRVVNGIADVEFGLQGYTSTVFPRTLLMEIPLQYGSPTEATRALWKIFDKHMASEYSRVKVIALWGTDVPVVMTNKIVRVPSDLTGLKLRTPSANQAAIIKGFGAVPVAMPMTQTYGAIEKGVVDGAVVGISVVNSFKLAEVVKNYIVDLPMGYSPQMIVMNRKTYDGLTAAQRAAVDKHSGLELSLKAARSYEQERDHGIDTVKKRADTRITALTPAEKEKWVASLKTVVDGWVADFEKQGLPYRQMLSDYLAK